MKEIALPLHPRRARLDCRRCARDLRLFDRHQRTGAVGMLSALAADFHQTESGVGLASPPMAG